MRSRSEPLAAARVVACVVACLAGCRPSAESVEPEPPEVVVPELPSLEPEPEPVDLSPEPLPEGVVAEVDGEPILQEELRRLVQTLGQQEGATAPVRSAALLQLVERRLLAANADRLGILVSDVEIDGAIDSVASNAGLDRTELEAAVSEAGLGWDEYRKEILAQLVEMKVMQVLGVFEAGLGLDEVERRRARLVGCLRARSEVQIDDESLVLPDNPYGLRTEIGELELRGELGLPEEELRAVAMEAAESRMHLCDALSTAELALQERLMERGYLEATVHLPWPDDVVLPVKIEAQVQAGRLHLIGRVRFDQSALPRGKRLDVADLQRRVGLFLTEGEVATLSAMQEASREVSDEFARMGLGEVTAEVERTTTKQGVRVDVVYRAIGGG